MEGCGLFAKKNIKSGEIVFIKSGKIVTVKEADKLEKELGEYCLQISEQFCLCPTTKEEVVDTAIFINHSCEPNVGPQGEITFVALRDIKAGEELCYDYAMTTARKYELTWACGTSNCRRTITGDDWKRLDLKKKYGTHFVPFILNKQEPRK